MAMTVVTEDFEVEVPRCSGWDILQVQRDIHLKQGFVLGQRRVTKIDADPDPSLPLCFIQEVQTHKPGNTVKERAQSVVQDGRFV